jgi:hypothetical protein
MFRYAAKGHDRNTNFQLWTHENHAVWLADSNMLIQRLNYIHNNPVKAGWVAQPEDYLYSSALNYAGKRV